MASKFVAIILIFITTSGFMFGIKAPLSAEWKNRFSNVGELNSYGLDSKILIRNATLGDIRVVGAKINGSVFDNTDWNTVYFLESEISNAHFKKGKYRDAAFQKSVIENTVFEDITFIRADFQGAKLRNVRFVNCNFGRANFQYLEDSDVVFDGAVLEEVQFYRSGLDVAFLGSKLTDIEMMGVKGQRALIVKNSDIYGIDLGNSAFPYVEVIDSKVQRTVFGSGKAKRIVMKNLKGALNTDGAVVKGNVLVENVEAEVLFLGGITAEEIYVKNALVTNSIIATAMEAKKFEITNSNIKSIWNGASKLKYYKIANTDLRGTRSENSRIDKFHLESVHLNGKFNFEHTHAKNLELINVTKGPDFQFRGEGGNIAF